MKKILMVSVMLLFAGGVFAGPSIFVANYSACSVTIRVSAHDGMTGACAFMSNAFVLPSGYSVTIADVTDLNGAGTTYPSISATIHWVSGTAGSSGVWDRYFGAAMGGACSFNVGSACGASSSATLTCCTSEPVGWTIDGNGDYWAVINP